MKEREGEGDRVTGGERGGACPNKGNMEGFATFDVEVTKDPNC